MPYIFVPSGRSISIFIDSGDLNRTASFNGSCEIPDFLGRMELSAINAVSSLCFISFLIKNWFSVRRITSSNSPTFIFLKRTVLLTISGNMRNNITSSSPALIVLPFAGKPTSSLIVTSPFCSLIWHAVRSSICCPHLLMWIIPLFPEPRCFEFFMISEPIFLNK